MPPWSRQTALQRVCRELADVPSIVLDGNLEIANRRILQCENELETIWHSCMAARGMYATNARLRNHIYNLGHEIEEMKNELNDARISGIEAEEKARRVKLVHRRLSTINFVPEEKHEIET